MRRNLVFSTLAVLAALACSDTVVQQVPQQDQDSDTDTSANVADDTDDSAVTTTPRNTASTASPATSSPSTLLEPTTPYVPSSTIEPYVPAQTDPIGPPPPPPVPVVVTPSQVVDQYGFVLKISSAFTVTENGYTSTCWYDEPEPEESGDAGAAVGPDAGAVAAVADGGVPIPPPVQLCQREYRLSFHGNVTDGENIHEFDMQLIIDPASNGRNPRVVDYSAENADGSLRIADNIDGSLIEGGWWYDAAALDASTGHKFQFQLNQDSAPKTAFLQQSMRDLLKDFRIVAPAVP